MGHCCPSKTPEATCFRRWSPYPPPLCTSQHLLSPRSRMTRAHLSARRWALLSSCYLLPSPEPPGRIHPFFLHWGTRARVLR